MRDSKSRLVGLGAAIFAVAQAAAGSPDYWAGKTAETAGDYERAASRYHAAAIDGYLEAQLALARLYDLGRGVPASATEASRWYEEAGKRGDATAQTLIGHRYESVATPNTPTPTPDG